LLGQPSAVFAQLEVALLFLDLVELLASLLLLSNVAQLREAIVRGL